MELSEALKSNLSLTSLNLFSNLLLVSFHSHSIQKTRLILMELSSYMKHSNQIQPSLRSISTVISIHTSCFFFSLNTGNKIDSELAERIQAMCKQNKERNEMLWREIHDCIRTNDLQQLMTLLSKHSINLNSFNLSTDGDTVLHSAAKSNNVKMIEFVLQRISPSTKQRMLQMRNKELQHPSDLILTRWTPSIHSLFPLKFRQVVKAVLMLGAKRQDGTPYYPQTHFYKLPKDVLFIILQYVV
jgi:hypothetical protein